MALTGGTKAARNKGESHVRAAKLANGRIVWAYAKGEGTRLKTPSTAQLVHLLEQGLPIHELEDLQGALDLPMAKLAELLGISRATLQRRKTTGVLSTSESDRIVRYARLMGLAVEVLESQEAARRWLRTPQFGLGMEVPLDYARTEVGAREVEDLLGRMEHGVYS